MAGGDLVVALLIGVAAVAYSAVGHGGASAYLAVMALAGLPPEVIRPAALLLNALVSSIAAWRFARAGHLSWRLFLPFAVASVPAAFIGGFLTLPARGYQITLGVVLAYAGARMFLGSRTAADRATSPPPVGIAAAAGGAIGFVSGLIGLGGGIFLSPLILLLGWSGVRTTAAVSALFILVNSLAGLAGHMAAAPALPVALPAWAAAAVLGGWIGSGLGSRTIPRPALLRVLALVLILASVKLILVA